MSDTIPERPRAPPTADTQPYWDGLASGKILLQRCTSCSTIRHYPRPVCAACFSLDHDWVPACGDATVHSWTITHHAFHPAFKAALPYALVTADLPEGVRVIAPLVGVDAGTLRIGLSLRLVVDGVTGMPALKSAS